MTKKDYQLLANEIAKIRDANVRVQAADAVARACWVDSPRFNYTRFMEECHVTPLQPMAQIYEHQRPKGEK
jgi:hypothetical protein